MRAVCCEASCNMVHLLKVVLHFFRYLASRHIRKWPRGMMSMCLVHDCSFASYSCLETAV